jgi:hypothetical protein
MATNNNIGVKDIIQLIGLIALGAACFMGATYQRGLVFGIIIALGIILAAYGIVFLLVKLKQAKQDQAQMKVIEYLLLIFGYGTIICISGFFALHYTTIETIKKEQIRQESTASINEIVTIREEYGKYVDSTEKIYKTKIENGFTQMNRDKNSSILDKIKRIEKNESIDYNINKKISEVRNQLGDENVIRKADQDLKNGLESINSMDILSISDVLNNLQTKKENYLNSLIENSRLFVEKNENDNVAEEFKYVMQYTENLSDRLHFNWNSDFKNAAWEITIPVLLIIHLMILWVYFFSSRFRSKGVSGRDGAKGGFTW